MSSVRRPQVAGPPGARLFGLPRPGHKTGHGRATVRCVGKNDAGRSGLVRMRATGLSTRRVGGPSAVPNGKRGHPGDDDADDHRSRRARRSTQAPWPVAEDPNVKRTSAHHPGCQAYFPGCMEMMSAPDTPVEGSSQAQLAEALGGRDMSQCDRDAATHAGPRHRIAGPSAAQWTISMWTTKENNRTSLAFRRAPETSGSSRSWSAEPSPPGRHG